MSFAGALTALVTPFRDDAIDEPALRALVDEQIDKGIDGLCPCGTTGESVNLSDAEYRQVVSVVVDQAKGRVPVVAGAGTASTRHTLELCAVAREAGVDGVLIVSPYYNRPSQRGLHAHFKAVADGAGVPVILYNIPGRTGVDVSLETMARLADDCASIVAVKEATGNVTRSADLAARFGDRFAILSGDDSLTVAIMAVGGSGVISVASNVVPAEVARAVKLQADGDVAAANALQQKLRPLYEALFLESSPCPVKAALAMQGKIGEELRLPLVGVSDETRAHLRAVLQQLEVL
jgi:4-hydroxy-tetrahydrodipicolinate synthase